MAHASLWNGNKQDGAVADSRPPRRILGYQRDTSLLIRLEGVEEDETHVSSPSPAKARQHRDWPPNNPRRYLS